MYDPPVHGEVLSEQKPPPEGVVHVRTQHCMLSAVPGQYPATLVPSQSLVARQVPVPVWRI